MAFLYLTAQVTIYGIEANVVHAERLWPRSLTTDNPTAADLQQLANLTPRRGTVSEDAEEEEEGGPSKEK